MLGTVTTVVTHVAPSEPFVLLVDDHAPSLEGLRMVVESAGHACVASPTPALALGERCRPALVVTDLSMPRLDGRSLGRWFRARHPGVPLVLVTGESLTADEVRVLRRTFAAVFAKPLDVPRFLDAVAGLLPPRPSTRPKPGAP